jgi:predicted Zn-dependent protease
VIFLNKFFKFFLFFFLSGCLSFEYNVATHKKDIIFYSTEKEISIGENLAKRISSSFNISSNPYYIERIHRIGEKIVQVCDRKEINYYFYVIEEDKKNAFSIPGGYVYIYKGLLDILNDEELAFVIAHEIAHIVSRHAIKKLQATLGANLLIAASTATNNVGFAKEVSLALEQIFSGYSQEDEFCADILAVKYMERAGFNPQVSLLVLEKIYQEDKKNIRPFPYLRTHPFTSQRIRNIKENLGISLNVEDYINF